MTDVIIKSYPSEYLSWDLIIENDDELERAITDYAIKTHQRYEFKEHNIMVLDNKIVCAFHTL